MNGGSEADAVSCANPIDAAVLADYWLAALTASDEAAVEEHLLGCHRCTSRLQHVIALAEGVRNLAREGSLRMVVTDAFLQRAAEDGLRVREYAPPPGGSIQCTVTADDDLLVARLAADLSGATRIDLRFFDERGVERSRLADIPVRPGATSVVLQESITFAKASPSYVMTARLVALDERGGERLLGEYTFNHTRTMLGPAAW